MPTRRREYADARFSLICGSCTGFQPPEDPKRLVLTTTSAASLFPYVERRGRGPATWTPKGCDGPQEKARRLSGGVCVSPVVPATKPALDKLPLPRLRLRGCHLSNRHELGCGGLVGLRAFNLLRGVYMSLVPWRGGRAGRGGASSSIRKAASLNGGSSTASSPPWGAAAAKEGRKGGAAFDMVAGTAWRATRVPRVWGGGVEKGAGSGRRMRGRKRGRVEAAQL